MIEIVRFDHVGIAAPTLGPQVEIMERLFGFRPGGEFESDEGYSGVSMQIPGRSSVRWEVIAPRDNESFLHRFLASPRGPGLHHVALDVTSTAQARAAIREEQIEPWGTLTTDGIEEDIPGETIYLHPRSGGRGLLWQLNADVDRAPATPFDDDGATTLGIVDVNHLGHATSDRRDLAAWYERTFGCHTVWESPDTENESGLATHVLRAPTQELRFEAIEPAGPASPLTQFIEQRGEAMHHVTFEVGDWSRAIAACQAHKVRTLGVQSGERHGAQWSEAFIPPQEVGGVLVQLFWQERPGTWV